MKQWSIGRTTAKTGKLIKKLLILVRNDGAFEQGNSHGGRNKCLDVHVWGLCMDQW